MKSSMVQYILGFSIQGKHRTPSGKKNASSTIPKVTKILSPHTRFDLSGERVTL